MALQTTGLQYYFCCRALKAPQAQLVALTVSRDVRVTFLRWPQKCANENMLISYLKYQKDVCSKQW
jgi:hypothetical protein